MVTWMPYCLACSSCSVNKTKRDQYTVQKRVRLGSGYVIYATQPKPLLLRCFLFLFVLLTERVEQATWKKWQERDAFSLSRRTLRQFRAIFLLQQKSLMMGLDSFGWGFARIHVAKFQISISQSKILSSFRRLQILISFRFTNLSWF